MMRVHLLTLRELVEGQTIGAKSIQIGKLVGMEKCSLLLIFWTEVCRFFLLSEN